MLLRSRHLRTCCQHVRVARPPITVTDSAVWGALGGTTCAHRTAGRARAGKCGGMEATQSLPSRAAMLHCQAQHCQAWDVGGLVGAAHHAAGEAWAGEGADEQARLLAQQRGHAAHVRRVAHRGRRQHLRVARRQHRRAMRRARWERLRPARHMLTNALAGATQSEVQQVPVAVSSACRRQL